MNRLLFQVIWWISCCLDTDDLSSCNFSVFPALSWSLYAGFWVVWFTVLCKRTMFQWNTQVIMEDWHLTLCPYCSLIPALNYRQSKTSKALINAHTLWPPQLDTKIKKTSFNHCCGNHSQIKHSHCKQKINKKCCFSLSLSLFAKHVLLYHLYLIHKYWIC